MIKALAFISAILVFICPAYEGLECYHCYTNSGNGKYDGQLRMCNEQNMTASNTMVCPDNTSKCIYEILESEHIKLSQIWRTCSNPKFRPCDPNSAPSGFKMKHCTFCDTDRCNLYGKEAEKNTFTININANVSLSIE